MRISRVFIESILTVNSHLVLPKETAHYLTNVLRLKQHASLILFNGNGSEYAATITALDKKSVTVQIEAQHLAKTESSLVLILVQALARPEHMDYSLQKAVELGVHQIVPVLTERSPPVAADRRDKRQQHWLKLMRSACEQCGRNHIPELKPLQPLSDWLAQPQAECALVPDPLAQQGIAHLMVAEPCAVAVLIGPEGGLTEAEVTAATQAGYQPIRLGPRILRTETAATTMLTACQLLWGDLRL